MFRHFLLISLLAGTAAAQTPATTTTTVAVPPAPAAVPAPARYTAADTVRAIHRLFNKHRKVGSLLTVGALGADLALASVSVAAEGNSHSSGNSGYGWSPGGLTFGFGGFAVIYGVMLAPVMGVGIQQMIAYSPRREARILARYNATGQLPAKTRRQLRRHLR